MNQEMQNEIKALAVAATLEYGSTAIEKLKNLHDEIQCEINKLKDDEIIKDIDAWTHITNYIPEELGFKLIQAIDIFENTEIGDNIGIQKSLIDKELTDEINNLNDVYDEFEMYEKVNLARIYVINFSKKYQELAWQINEVIK